jgi:polar amino acid transport system substrate-binding protein
MKKVVQVGLVVLLLAVALSACGPKAAANHLDQIKQNGKITIGTSADYPPFESVDASGNFVGFDIDLMNEIGKRMGVDVEIVDMPFDSLLAAVQEGKIDISIAAFNFNEERDQTVDFTDPYYYAEDGFLVADNFAGQINAPEDIASLKVGVQTGATADGWVTDNLVSTGLLPEENLFRYERMDQAALDVKNGRIDVLMTDYIPAEALAKQVGGVKVVYHAEVSTGPVNIVVPEGDTALTEALNKIIKDMNDDGTIDQIAIKNIGA